MTPNSTCNAEERRSRAIKRDLDRVTGLAEPKTVSVPLSQVAGLLLEAAQTNRAWLSDFADDAIRMDADLFDVLLAYQTLRSSPAA